MIKLNKAKITLDLTPEDVKRILKTRADFKQ